jgi:hypothetical protein
MVSKVKMYMQVGTEVWILEVRHAYIEVVGPALLEGKGEPPWKLINLFHKASNKQQLTLTKTHEQLKTKKKLRKLKGPAEDDNS